MYFIVWFWFAVFKCYFRDQVDELQINTLHFLWEPRVNAKWQAPAIRRFRVMIFTPTLLNKQYVSFGLQDF
jgi:hypothetical protein